MATTGRTTPTQPARSKTKPTVHFDIAKAESELDEGEVKEPFGVRLKDGGVVYLRPAAEIGWQEAAGVDLRDPFLTMRGLLSEEDYQEFVKEDFKNPVLQDMLIAWREHNGLPDLGN